MDNETDGKNKRLADVDTATMWLSDAQIWMDVAKRLDRESGYGQDNNPVNHHILNVARACTGMAFELAYKSLLVAELKQPKENYSIEAIHKRLKAETQEQVEEGIKEAVCKGSGDLLKHLGEYMAPPDKRYWMERQWEKEKRGSVITTGIETIPELAEILYKLVNLGEGKSGESKRLD